MAGKRTTTAAIAQIWPIVDNADIQLRPPAVAGGPYAHRFEHGVCKVCGYREGEGANGCPWNAGTVFSSVPADKRAR